MNYPNRYGAGGKMPAWLLKRLKHKSMFNGGKLRYYAIGGELDKLTGEERVMAGPPPESPTPTASTPPLEGKEAELFAALNRANRASRDEKLPPKTADGFIIEGEDDPNENIIKDVIQASETTNRVGGFDPQIPIMRYVPRKPTMTKTIEEKPGDIIPPPPPPLPPPPKKDPEYKPTTKPTFTTDDGVLSSMPIFKRGIESTGMRGQGTTGNFRGVRSDIGQDGRLIERGEIVNVDDMPEYIREDPTFKNLLSQANETKYMQDIGKEEGLYATPGGQAAKDLADIMSGRITLDAYKERQNRASASFGYGGKMKFGVIKKRRGGR